MQGSHQLQSKIAGGLWGAVLGDVIGAHLEFDQDVTPTKIQRAFSISGGGKHRLQPGQPTDDSELAYSVLKGISRQQPTINFNFIAEQMGKWFLSKPFDVGNTIRNSVPKACNMKVHQAHLCRKGAHQCSQKSQSNGSLMAIIGLSMWCRSLKVKDLMRVIRQYTWLIHSNEMVVLANQFYTLIVHYLLNHIEDPQRRRNSFQFARETIFEHCQNAQFSDWISLIERSFKDRTTLEKQLPLHKASGWVRVALSYSVHFLVTKTPYREAIEWIIGHKGDTDTNACIMGGLLGVYYGVDQLQMQPQIDKIRSWQSNNRPQWLNPGKVIPKYISLLASSSPSELKMVGSKEEYPPFSKK